MPKEKPQNTDSSTIDTIPTGTKQQRQVEKEKQEKKRQEATREGIERIEEDEREGTKKAEELIESIILMIPSPLTRKQVKEKQKQDRSERRKRVLEKVLAWISGETPKEEKRRLLKTSTINNLIKLDKIEVPIDRVLWALHNYPDREEQILQPRYYERFKKCWGGFKHLTARIFKTSEKMSIITNKDFVKFVKNNTQLELDPIEVMYAIVSLNTNKTNAPEKIKSMLEKAAAIISKLQLSKRYFKKDAHSSLVNIFTKTELEINEIENWDPEEERLKMIWEQASQLKNEEERQKIQEVPREFIYHLYQLGVDTSAVIRTLVQNPELENELLNETTYQNFYDAFGEAEEIKPQYFVFENYLKEVKSPKLLLIAKTLNKYTTINKSNSIIILDEIEENEDSVLESMIQTENFLSRIVEIHGHKKLEKMMSKGNQQITTIIQAANNTAFTTTFIQKYSKDEQEEILNELYKTDIILLQYLPQIDILKINTTTTMILYMISVGLIDNNLKNGNGDWNNNKQVQEIIKHQFSQKGAEWPKETTDEETRTLLIAYSISLRNPERKLHQTIDDTDAFLKENRWINAETLEKMLPVMEYAAKQNNENWKNDISKYTKIAVQGAFVAEKTTTETIHNALLLLQTVTPKYTTDATSAHYWLVPETAEGTAEFLSHPSVPTILKVMEIDKELQENPEQAIYIGTNLFLRGYKEKSLSEITPTIIQTEKSITTTLQQRCKETPIFKNRHIIHINHSQEVAGIDVSENEWFQSIGEKIGASYTKVQAPEYTNADTKKPQSREWQQQREKCREYKRELRKSIVEAPEESTILMIGHGNSETFTFLSQKTPRGNPNINNNSENTLSVDEMADILHLRAQRQTAEKYTKPDVIAFHSCVATSYIINVYQKLQTMLGEDSEIGAQMLLISLNERGLNTIPDFGSVPEGTVGFKPDDSLLPADEYETATIGTITENQKTAQLGNPAIFYISKTPFSKIRMLQIAQHQKQEEDTAVG